MMNNIAFESDAGLTASEVLTFYRRHDHPAEVSVEDVQDILDRTVCVVSARQQGELIGFARGEICGSQGLIAECKLAPEFQGPACISRLDGRIEDDALGIAREMASRVIEQLRSHHVETIGALAYETEVDFCRELGFARPAGVVWMQLQCDKAMTESNEEKKPVSV